jgi:hypothetical protein
VHRLAKLGMNHDQVFSTLYHTFTVLKAMWIDGQEVSVKGPAQKMPLAMARAGVMVRIAS